MNLEQIKSIATTLLGMVGSFLAGWSATQGGFLVGNWEQIVGVIMILITLAWKLISNRDDGVIQAAAGLDQVQKVVVKDPAKAMTLTAPGAVVSVN